MGSGARCFFFCVFGFPLSDSVIGRILWRRRRQRRPLLRRDGRVPSLSFSFVSSSVHLCESDICMIQLRRTRSTM
jgi:hypothetical protein